KVIRCSPIRAQVIRDELVWDKAIFLHSQILDVAEAQGEPDIKPDRLLDNLGREAVAAIDDLGHHRWLRLKARNGKPADNVTRSPSAQPARRFLSRSHSNSAISMISNRPVTIFSIRMKS